MARLMFHISELVFDYLQLLPLSPRFASEKWCGATGRTAGVAW
jgi:hypothetical protein